MSTTATGEPLMTVQDLGKLLQVNRRTIYSWIQSGKVPCPDLDIGNVKRWRPKTIQDWIDSQKKG